MSPPAADGAKMRLVLSGLTYAVVGEHPALARAGELLRLLGADVRHSLEPGSDEAGALVSDGDGDHPDASIQPRPEGGLRLAVPPAQAPVVEWALSGALLLSGAADGPPLPGPPAVPTRLQAAALVAGLLADRLGGSLAIDGPALLGERAAIAGLQRHGRTSIGGASRLFSARDGWIAVTLARPTDFELLPAWIGRPASPTDPWDDVARHVASHMTADLVGTGQLLGLPVSAAHPPGSAPAAEPWRITTFHRPNDQHRAGRPLVADLTSLWAGPLCTSLLSAAGARVIKVEGASRPDGARRGPPAFFDLLNAGKESVQLDLDHPDGRRQLRSLLDAADVVVESARPRVMRHWGIDVEDLLATAPSKTWVSVTGYGRQSDKANDVAFGDDAAAAGGLLALDTDGAPCFCADAAADPIAGLHAAVTALAGLVGGGSHLVDIALADVAASAVGPVSAVAPVEGSVRPAHEDGAWEVEVAGRTWPVAPPRARAATGAGPPLGRETDAVLAEFG